MGKWCVFCQTKHPSKSCFHPARQATKHLELNLAAYKESDANLRLKVEELEAENKRLLGEVVKGNQRDTSRAEEVRVLNMLVDTLRGKENEDES